MATPEPGPTTSRRRRKLVRIPHPHLPHLSLTQVRLLRLFLLLGLFSGLVLYAVFRSVRFQELLRRKTELVLAERLGRPVHIGGFDLALVPPSFVVRDVSIANDPRGLPGPCFAAAELEVRGVPYFFGRTLILPKFRVVSPTVVFEIFEDGSDNFSGLLRRKGAGAGGSGPDVQLKEAVVQRATVRFREWSAKLDVFLAEAAFTARPESLRARTYLDLSVRKMRLKLAKNETVEGALGLKATLMPGRLRLDEIHLRGSQISLDGSGGIDSLRKPELRLLVFIETRGEELERLFGIELPIRGPLGVRGTFRTLETGGFRARASFRLSDGEFGPFPMSAEGVVRIDSGGLLAHVTRADYAGGTLEATVRVERLKHPPLPVRLVLTGRGVGFESFFADLGLPGTGFLARADLDATLTWGKGGLARADGAGVLRLSPALGAVSAVKGRHAIPTSGGGPILVSDGRILFDGMPLLTAAGTRFSLGGSIQIGSWTPDLLLSARARDLADVQRVAENWYAAIQKEPLEPPLGLGGSGSFESRLTRAFGDPHVEGTFDAEDLSLRGARFGRTRAAFSVDRNVLTLTSFEAADGGGKLSLSGRVGWGGPIRGHYRFEEFVAGLDHWPLERVLAFLDFDLPMSGRITGRLPLAGVTPALRGEAPVVWEGAEAWGQKAGRVEGTLAFEGDRLRLLETTALLDRGSARGSGMYRYADGGYEFSLGLDQVAAGSLKALADAAPWLGGRITARMTGEGTVDQPGVALKGTIDDAAFDGRPLGEPDRAIAVTAGVAQGGWSGRVDVPGAGSLEAVAAPPGQGGTLRVSLDAAHLAPFGSLLGLPEEARFDGRISLGATLRPDVGAGGWTGSAEIREARLSAYGRSVTMPRTTTIRIEQGLVVVPRLDVEQTFAPGEIRPPVPTSGTLSGSVALAPGHSVEISATASIDAAFLAPLIRDAGLAGRLLLEAKVGGSASKPEVSGRILLDAVDYRPAQGTAIEGITGTLRLSTDRIQADDLRFRYSGGTIDAGGVLTLDGLKLTGVRANFHLSALKFQPTTGFRATLSGDLRLDGDPTLRSARGEITLDHAVYDADLNIDLTLLLSGRRSASISSAGPFDAVALDVRLVAPKGSIEIRNNVARMKLSGDLLLRGNVGRPVLFGQLDVEEGGRLKLRDLNYEITSGKIIFSNPSTIEPFFDVDAQTSVRTSQGDYRVRVIVTGTPTRLAPRFTSEPLLTEAQIVSLLATGTLPASAVGGAGAGSPSSDESVSKAARDLLTGLATEAITGRTKEFFRLDRLQIDPNYVGSTFTGPRVTIGKTFGQSFSATVAYQFGSSNSRQQQVITLEYQLSPNAFLQATQDENGIYSIDVKFRQRLR
jgi:hypothetical protein